MLGIILIKACVCGADPGPASIFLLVQMPTKEKLRFAAAKHIT
jgi:hypothetical protein